MDLPLSISSSSSSSTANPRNSNPSQFLLHQTHEIGPIAICSSSAFEYQESMSESVEMGCEKEQHALQGSEATPAVGTSSGGATSIAVVQSKDATTVASQAIKLKACVEKTVTELFVEYEKVYGSISQSISVPSNFVPAVGNHLQGFNRAAYKRLKCSEEVTQKTELERYLAELQEEESETFDLLQWWSKNAHRYPVIARMAKDILAIPTTTVSSESAFSAGGRILTDFRSSMSTFLVQCLICTQDWLKDEPLVTLEADLEFIQSLEEELMKSANSEGVPQDM